MFAQDELKLKGSVNWRSGQKVETSRERKSHLQDQQLSMHYNKPRLHFVDQMNREGRER